MTFKGFDYKNLTLQEAIDLAVKDNTPVAIRFIGTRHDILNAVKDDKGCCVARVTEGLIILPS